MPTLLPNVPLSMLVADPASELVAACVCDWLNSEVLNTGAQKDRACATPTS